MFGQPVLQHLAFSHLESVLLQFSLGIVFFQFDDVVAKLGFDHLRVDLARFQGEGYFVEFRHEVTTRVPSQVSPVFLAAGIIRYFFSYCREVLFPCCDPLQYLLGLRFRLGVCFQSGLALFFRRWGFPFCKLRLFDPDQDVTGVYLLFGGGHFGFQVFLKFLAEQVAAEQGPQVFFAEIGHLGELSHRLVVGLLEFLFGHRYQSWSGSERDHLRRGQGGGSRRRRWITV